MFGALRESNSLMSFVLYLVSPASEPHYVVETVFKIIMKNFRLENSNFAVETLIKPMNRVEYVLINHDTSFKKLPKASRLYECSASFVYSTLLNSLVSCLSVR